MLRILAFAVVPIHGDMSQSQRLGALSNFKSGNRKVLVATDVASRSVREENFLLISETFTVAWISLPSTLLLIMMYHNTRKIIFTA